MGACVDEADWWTLAEGYGIEDEDVVNAALDHFRVSLKVVFRTRASVS